MGRSIEIQVEACRLLGEHLGVDRAYYVEVNEGEGYARVERNYLRNDSPSIVGTFRLVDYGWTLPLLKRGETIVVVDVANSDIVPKPIERQWRWCGWQRISPSRSLNRAR